VGGTMSWSDTGLPAQHPYSAEDGCTEPGYDSQVVSEGRRGGDSPLTRVPVMRQGI
jgi:hypothetical protein